MDNGKKSHMLILSSRIFRFLFLISDIFGIGNYYVNKDLVVKSCVMFRVYGITIFIIIFVYFIFSLYHNSKIVFQDLLYLEYVAYWTGSLACFVTSIWKQEKFLKWLRKSWEIIRELEEEKLKKLFDTSSVVTFTGIALIISYCVIFYINSSHTNYSSISLFIYTALYGITVVIVLQFVTAITFLSSFFSEINDELNAMLKQLREKEDASETSLFALEYRQYFLKQDYSLQLAKIRSLCGRHHLYCCLTKELNDCYSAQMLLFTGLCFIEITFSVFYLTISDSTEKAKPQYSVAFLITWLLTYVTLLFGFTVSSQTLIDKAEQSGFLAHRIINGETKKTIKRMLEHFSLQVHHMGVEITAMGLFSVKNSLIYDMVGGVSSAIIILIQFHTYSS